MLNPAGRESDKLEDVTLFAKVCFPLSTLKPPCSSAGDKGHTLHIEPGTP